MQSVEIVEVGPRDGVQSVPTWIPTERKVALIRALIDAGVRRLETGSFVSPKAIAQMRDAEDVVRALGDTPGVRRMALVPNVKGAQRAMAAGMDEIIFVVSMTESHNRSNVRRSVAESIADLASLLQEVDPKQRLRMRIDLACAFDCPFEDRVPEAQVLANVERIVALREGMELALCDTTGMAMRDHVAGLFGACLERFSRAAGFAFHGHDTAGLAVSNALAAYEVGVRTFDASVAGLGGCPFAPGATGNVATEDLVFVFERMGVRTGIDLDRLLDAGAIASALPDAVTGGHARAIPRERLRRQLSA